MKALLLLLCGVLCFVSIGLNIHHRRACNKEVTGTFVGTKIYKGKLHSLLVTETFLFEYDYDGRHYGPVSSVNQKLVITFRRGQMAEKAGYQEGKPYPVFINPKQPHVFKTRDGASGNDWVLWAGGILLTWMGLAGLL